MLRHLRASLLLTLVSVGCGAASAPPRHADTKPDPRRGQTAAQSDPAGVAAASPPAMAALPAPTGDVIDVSAGFEHACALARHGTVWCWGANRDGEVGDGTHRTRDTARQVRGLSDAVAIAAGWRTSCAIRRGGAVVCWGAGFGPSPSTVPVPVAGVDDAVQISLTGTHACVRRATGTVACWGDNRWGELGDGTTVSRANAVDVVGVSDAVGIATGAWGVSCAWNARGEAMCWGNDEYGALGLAKPVDTKCPKKACSLLPRRMDAADVVDIAAEDHSTCALSRSGEVKCWGVRNSCMRGGAEPDASDREESWRRPTVVPGLVASALVSNLCARDAGGALQCWGNAAFVDGAPSQRRCAVSPPIAEVPVSPVRISVAPHIGCALAPDDTITCWGHAASGERGNGARDPHRHSPVASLFTDPPADLPTPVSALAASLSSHVGSGLGLVWRNATLYADDHTPIGRLETFHDDQRGDLSHGRLPIRVIQASADWVTIETLPAADAPSGGEPIDAQLRWRANVRRADLAPLLTRDVTVKLGDGTPITLGKGTAVEPTSRGFVVDLPKDLPPLPLDATAIGLTYPRAGRAAPTPAAMNRGDAGSVAIAGRGGRSKVVQGAKAYWESGQAAGATTWEWKPDAAPESIGGRACFRIGAEVRVCFDEKDVAR